MGKGGSQEVTQKVELPPEIKEAAMKNMGVAENVAALPYVPNFGLQMAAFTPSQEASFANTNAAANAFGLPQAQGTGLPQAQNVGGFRGYSTKDLYNDMMSKVNPQVKDLYNAFFTPQGRAAMGADPISALLGRGPGAPATNNKTSTGSGERVKSFTNSKGQKLVWDAKHQAYRYADPKDNAAAIRNWFSF